MQIDLARTALVSMDFQPSILASLPDHDGLIARVAETISATRRSDAKIGFVRVAFTPTELKAFPPHNAMGQRMNALGDKVMADAPTTQIDARLAPQVGDIVVRKRRVGPFSTTDLDAQLKSAGIDTLVICGIHTSGCVLTGVREAYDLDYRVIVLGDCCADPDNSVHEFLTGTIFPRQAAVMRSAEYIASLQKAAEA